MTNSFVFDYPYVQGYTAALQDVLQVFEDIQGDLKHHKRKQNYKTYKAIVETMLANRCELRENPDAFIRCNDKVPGGFELWENGKGQFTRDEIESWEGGYS